MQRHRRAPCCFWSTDESGCVHLITLPKNLRVKFRASAYHIWFDCPLHDYNHVLPSVVATVLIVSSWLCCLIFNLTFFLLSQQMIYAEFWCSLGLAVRKPPLHKSCSLHQHSTSLPDCPPISSTLSAQTDKYLFPCWGLLTASKPGNSPTAHSCKTRPCFPLSLGESYIHTIAVSHLSPRVGPHSVHHPSEAEQWHHCLAINSLTAW